LGGYAKEGERKEIVAWTTLASDRVQKGGKRREKMRGWQGKEKEKVKRSARSNLVDRAGSNRLHFEKKSITIESYMEMAHWRTPHCDSRLGVANNCSTP
jgi:hypothetical protein